MRFALIFSLLIAILAVVFALYNPDPTDIHIGPNYVLTSPLALVIIVTLLAGVVVGALFSVPNRLRSRSRIKKLEKRIAELETAPHDTVHETVVVEKDRPTSPAPVEPGASASGAAETERLAAETRQMAEDAQRRAAEAERRADES
jgi:putative membrane protein